MSLGHIFGGAASPARTLSRFPSRVGGEAEMLLAQLRAQDPVVVRALWQRYVPLVLPVLHYTLRRNQTAVDEAVLDVFLQVFRWGPSLPLDANLHVLVMRAVTRAVERLSAPSGFSKPRRRDR